MFALSANYCNSPIICIGVKNSLPVRWVAIQALLVYFTGASTWMARFSGFSF
jgi:hypothetical protein